VGGGGVGRVCWDTPTFPFACDLQRCPRETQREGKKGHHLKKESERSPEKRSNSGKIGEPDRRREKRREHNNKVKLARATYTKNGGWSQEGETGTQGKKNVISHESDNRTGDR